MGTIVLHADASGASDYPLFWQRYTADPWGIEHGGRLYLFCSHDTYDPARGYGYFMNDITCISTDDLKNWTDHGEVFRAADSKWEPGTLGRLAWWSVTGNSTFTTAMPTPEASEWPSATAPRGRSWIISNALLSVWTRRASYCATKTDNS